MIQHIVSEIGGVATLGVISICLFFAVFGGALIWALCLKRDTVASMETIPLRDEPAADGAKGEHQHE